MSKYEVTLWEKVTHTLKVEADSEEDAIDLAEYMLENGEPDTAHECSQGFYARTVNLIEEEEAEPEDFNSEIVTRCAPAWAWELIDETLALDAQSKAFDQATRNNVSAAQLAVEICCEESRDEPLPRSTVNQMMQDTRLLDD